MREQPAGADGRVRVFRVVAREREPRVQQAWKTQGSVTATITVGTYAGSYPSTAFQPSQLTSLHQESVSVTGISPIGQMVATPTGRAVAPDPTRDGPHVLSKYESVSWRCRGSHPFAASRRRIRLAEKSTRLISGTWAPSSRRSTVRVSVVLSERRCSTIAKILLMDSVLSSSRIKP